MDMEQPALFPECLPPEPTSAVELVARMPYLPTVTPNTWQEVNTYTRTWIFEVLYWAQKLDWVADATGLPLTDWYENDTSFKQQIDQVEAAAKIMTGVTIVQAGVVDKIPSMQIAMLKLLHNE